MHSTPEHDSVMGINRSLQGRLLAIGADKQGEPMIEHSAWPDLGGGDIWESPSSTVGHPIVMEVLNTPENVLNVIY